VSAFAAVGLLVAGCSSSGKKDVSDQSPNPTTSATSPAPSDEKVTLTIGLFGTFGYKEAGLYDEYMQLHPNVTIQETSVEFEDNYYQALQTHLAAGSGLSDIQGIEVARITEVVQTQADKFVNLNDLGAADVKDTFFPWKWAAATTSDGKTLGLGTDTGPLAICYRTDLFAQAGLPTNRDELTKAWSSWDAFLEMGKQYKAKAPAKSAFIDSSGGLFNTIIGQSKTQYYDESGNLVYDTNPAVKKAWDLSARAVTEGLTARLSQFEDAWNSGFSNGAFATIACPAWMIGYIKGQAGDAGSGKWDVAGVPGGGGNWGGSYLAIPKASKNQQAAYDLIQWLTAPEQQVKMWVKAQHFPSSSTAATDPQVASATDDYFNGAPIGKIFDASAENLVVATLGPKDGLMKGDFTNGLLLIAQQGKSPDSAWTTTLAQIKKDVS
jgi:cellobiose transport system substrate-binding protein